MFESAVADTLDCQFFIAFNALRKPFVVVGVSFLCESILAIAFVLDRASLSFALQKGLACRAKLCRAVFVCKINVVLSIARPELFLSPGRGILVVIITIASSIFLARVVVAEVLSQVMVEVVWMRFPRPNRKVLVVALTEFSGVQSYFAT